MKITLEKNQRERLRSIGLISIASTKHGKRGITRFWDPVTGARYLLSPRGFAYRGTDAGIYQLNPRAYLTASAKGTRRTRATLRTNDSGAQTELVIKGVRNFRKRF